MAFTRWGSSKRQSSTCARRGEDPYARARCLGCLSRVLRDQGRLSDALTTAHEAMALALTLPEACTPNPGTPFSFVDACNTTQASILERMGRLKEALEKDKLVPGLPVELGAIAGCRGRYMRVALSLVASDSLDDAKALLRWLIRAWVPGAERIDIEGPDLLLRAKELLYQVLHKQGGKDPQDQAEEAALRAELQQEEARRGEALREVRALICRVAADTGEAKTAGEEAGGAVVPAPKRNKKKSKKERRRRAAAAAAAAEAEEEEEEEKDGVAVAALPPAPKGGEEGDGDGPAPSVGEAVLQTGEEEGEDGCAICLQRVDDGLDGDGGACALACGHEYHATCIDAWVSKCVEKKLEVTCPFCRAPVSR
jgi:hypothetical protein